MEFYESPKQINGINLAEYHPNQRSYNSVVYVHKRILEEEKETRKKKEIKEKTEKEKKQKESILKKLKKQNANNIKVDKAEQCDEFVSKDMLGINNSLLAHSLRLTRTLVPVVIPPSGMVSPVYYTIKASKKKDNNIKKKPKQEVSALTQTLKKGKSKKVIETYRNTCAKESLSVKETVTSYSSQNDTLNELHINQSLCCSFSEISNHKQCRRERKEKYKHDSQKLIPSESFEVMANEFLNSTGDTKIKVHLMNETEKNLLAENIRVPVLQAIKDCIVELGNQRHNTDDEITAVVQRFVKCNTEKLDNVMDKLACIEDKIDTYMKNESQKLDEFIKSEQMKLNIIKDDIDKAKAMKLKSSKVQVRKASKLEQLGEDLSDLEKRNPLLGLELCDETSGDEFYKRPVLAMRKNLRGKSAVMRLEPADDKHEDASESHREEQEEPVVSNSAQLVRPDRPNRIPTRFCWTDAAKKAAA